MPSTRGVRPELAFQPVLDPEPIDTVEFLDVVRDECQSERERVRGDEEVVLTYRPSLGLEAAADCAIVRVGRHVECQDLDFPQGGLYPGSQLLRAPLLRSVAQF